MKRLTATLALLLLTGPVFQAEEGTQAALPGAGSQPVDAVKAGVLVVEPPTLICLGFEWEIAGDQNRNATVAVAYRRARTGPRLDAQDAWSRRCRCCGWAAKRSSALRTPFPIGSPAASWTSIRTPSTRCDSP